MDSVIDKKCQEWQRSNLPFALYRKPKTSRIKAIFQFDNQLHSIKDCSESGFVFAPFDEKENIFFIRNDELHSEEVSHLEANTLDIDIPAAINENAKKAFKTIVQKAVSTINRGELEKVVLSRKIEVQTPLSALAIFKRLVALYENAFCYLWHHPKVGTWLGATPEILIKTRGNFFSTMSLAGTQITDDFKSQPNWTKKEIHEQRLVTEYIEKVLKEKAQNLKVGNLESVKAGHLWHLRTEITGSFKKENLMELIRSLHPTPAVCGIPKSKAKEFIKENESYDRSFYTGFLGELNFKSEKERNVNPKNKENSVYKSVMNLTELYVNLRCMNFKDQLATLYVGGGITKTSQPQNEWQETENKSHTLLKVL